MNLLIEEIEQELVQIAESLETVLWGLSKNDTVATLKIEQD
jgi:hypothetical protein